MAVAEKSKVLSLEVYDSFFHLPGDFQRFSIPQLQQIVLIHGFCKPKTKSQIMTGMRTVDMIPPARSTVRKPRAAEAAGISVDEVRADIAALGWGECPIGSLATVSAAAEGSTGSTSPADGFGLLASPVDGLGLLASAASAVEGRRKRRRPAPSTVPLLSFY